MIDFQLLVNITPISACTLDAFDTYGGVRWLDQLHAGTV